MQLNVDTWLKFWLGVIENIMGDVHDMLYLYDTKPYDTFG